MKGLEIRRLIEGYDHDGVFDGESASRDIKEKDALKVDAIRTLVILANAVRTLDALSLLDDSSKCATTWAWRFEYNKASYCDLEEILSVRPGVIIQLVKRLYNL